MGTACQQRTVQPPLDGILDTASLELHELQARLRQLTERIRTLKRALAALRELESASVALPQPASGASADQNAPASEYSEVALRSNPALRRACRIALLETCDGLSEEEMLVRITRRGSYTFSDPYSAKIEIANELNAMSQAGQVEQLKCSSGSKWKRVEPASEIATDFV
jgi:hypothetical protein